LALCSQLRVEDHLYLEFKSSWPYLVLPSQLRKGRMMLTADKPKLSLILRVLKQQGCQIFLVTTYTKLYQITTKYTKLPQNIPNYHKTYQITTKCTKCPQNIPNVHQIDQTSTK
jgi:hypothetical protein